jgi:hypothetical protein
LTDVLSAYYVVLSIDKNHPEQLKRMAEYVIPHSHSRFQILTADSTLLEELDMVEAMQDLRGFARQLEAIAHDHKIPALDASVRAGGPAWQLGEPPGASLALAWEVTSRLAPLELERPPRGTQWRYPRYPTDPLQSLVTGTLFQTLRRRSQVVVGARSGLTEPELRRLIPSVSDRVEGRSWSPPRDLVARMVCEFRPPTWYTQSSPETISHLEYAAQLRKVSAASFEVALRGYVQGPDPWFPTEPVPPAPSPVVMHQAKARFTGYYRVRLPEARVERLAVVTDGAVLEAEDDTFLPFVTVLEATGSSCTGPSR